MNDPVAASGRLACVAVMVAVVIVRPTTGPGLVRIAILGLAGLSILPVLGWLRTLWFTPAAAAGLAALTTDLVLQTGQAVPVALLAATLAGAAVGAVVAVVTERVHLGARPWVSLLFTVTVWAALLPRVSVASASPPLFFGVDLTGRRSLALLALGLLGCGVWGIGNLARTRAGRQIGAAGSSPTLALRTGATPTAVWLRTGVISGVLAGWAGLVLALGAPAGSGVGQFSPATAVTWLAVPLLGGPMWVSGVLTGAVVVGGVAAVSPLSETAIAGLALAAVALTRGGGLVGAVLQRRGGP